MAHSINISIKLMALILGFVFITSCGKENSGANDRSVSKSIEYFSNNRLVSPDTNRPLSADYYHEDLARICETTLYFTRTAYKDGKSSRQWIFSLSASEIRQINDGIAHINETDTDVLSDDILLGATYSYLLIDGAKYKNNWIYWETLDSKYHLFSSNVKALFNIISDIITHRMTISNGNIPFRVIEAGQNSGYTETGGVAVDDISLIVIKSSDELEKFWQLHKSNIFPVESVPAINFDSKMIIVIMCPVYPTGGYSIYENNLYISANTLVVSATQFSPGGCIVTSALTQPYIIIEVDKTDIPVSLTLDHGFVDCY